MRKHPSTIESTHRSTVYRTPPVNPAVLSMPAYSAFDKKCQLANDFQHQCEIVQAGNHDI
jgi:hypothetical protein